MNEGQPLLDIAAPRIVIVAEGDNAGAQANARGHLFELFMARVFEAYGCEPPSKSSVNVRQNGYEVDIAARITLTSEAAIAECKAYSSVLPVSAVSNFYGKLSAERLDAPSMHGWFVAVPGLTAEGHEFVRKLEAKDKRFKLVTATMIYALAKQKQWLEQITPSAGTIVLSDHALLLTASGVAALAKELDPGSRLPVRVLVYRTSGKLSATEIALVAADEYAGSLPVQDIAAAGSAQDRHAISAEAPTLVTVVGSAADFEYQFPAAPEFFVGRENLLAIFKKVSEEADACGRVVVLNAQSGWGKSSLALRIADQVESSGGAATVMDTRTAVVPQYVSAALRKAMTEAEGKGKLLLPADASFASLQSTLKTLQSSTWKTVAPLLIFFDQFENVFREPRLTQEFRDLALAVREISSPIILGFSWKTDLVGLTENYPYHLRDEIRGAALVINVEPFGPTEVGTLLRRLAKVAKASLSSDLKQRLREYSQGLPWLLKKLASHILKQLQAGTTEETLLAESLNIEGLFEQDLAVLDAPEVEALRSIAREAPVLVTEIVERVNPSVIQSLVDQRLVVRVGERIDVYWDTFREFLLTGKVAVEDTYLLRQRAASTSKLLQFVVRKGGEVSSVEAARELSTSQHVVFNAARELRQLGVLVPKSGSLLLSEQLRSGPPNEALVRERVAKSLRRHTVFARLQVLLGNVSEREVSLDTLAAEMPVLFPAVEATPHTWRSYAGSFGSWLDYAGLVHLRGQILCEANTGNRKTTLLSTGEHLRKTFPQGSPEKSIQYLYAKVHGTTLELNSSSTQKAHNDLYVLGLVDGDGNLFPHMISCVHQLISDSPVVPALRSLLTQVTGGQTAVSLIESQSDVRPEVVGEVLRSAYGLPWALSTTTKAGSMFRAWARKADIFTTKVRGKVSQ